MSSQYSILNPMSLLLKGQGYPPAVCFAVAVHAILLYFLLDRELAPRDMVDLEPRTYISAATINENPQQVNSAEQERQMQEAEAAQREAEAEAARQREAEAQAAREAAAREEAERQAAEEARRQQELNEQQARQQQQEEARRQAEAEAERARQEQLAREQEAQMQAEREAEAARQAAAQQAAAEQVAAENAMIGNYEGIIHRTISDNWSIPPSARNGMSVLLNIRLVPTGEVVSVEVVESSGDAVFDRSAEQAVLNAGRFPELQDMPINLFERQFRSLFLLFRPEDLLR